jgi:hypothetical protein
MEGNILNKVLVEWIVFRETHEGAWGEKRGNKFVMGTVENGILKEIELDEE